MRKLLGVAGIVSMLASVPGHAQITKGALGPVEALGQESATPRPAQTGPAPRLRDGTIDLNGVWVGGGSINDIAQGLPKGETLPLLPASNTLMEFRAQHPTDDPHLWCAPMGVPRTTPYPFRFAQNYSDGTPTHIYILHEATIHTYRQIFMDGRKHPEPEELLPTWFGHSIGRWDGDTLIVDTIGYNGKNWYDQKGVPYTDQLHTIERYSRPNYGTLIDNITIEDPGAFTRPINLKLTATHVRPDIELSEFICLENNQYGIAGGFRPGTGIGNEPLK